MNFAVVRQMRGPLSGVPGQTVEKKNQYNQRAGTITMDGNNTIKNMTMN